MNIPWSEMSEGTILAFGIRYPNMITSKVFNYAMIKAGGSWYVTGSGRVPIAATSTAVERWLERDGREVVWAKRVTEMVDLWPAHS